jgi:hypothetical protein
MTVFVDSLFMTAASARWPYHQACHMFTDGNEQELHDFAARLGLKRSWFQRHKTLWHYDLTANKRKEALRLGASPIDGREYGKLLLRLVEERRAHEGDQL